MGLSTIDPHSHKVQTKLYKIPKFGVNRPNSKQETAIWKCQNLQKKCMAIRMLSDTASKWPYISLLILTFLNVCIPVKTSLIKGQMQRNLDNFSFVEKPLQNSQLYQHEAESTLKNKFCATCDVPEAKNR